MGLSPGRAASRAHDARNDGIASASASSAQPGRSANAAGTSVSLSRSAAVAASSSGAGHTQPASSAAPASSAGAASGRTATAAVPEPEPAPTGGSLVEPHPSTSADAQARSDLIAIRSHERAGLFRGADDFAAHRAHSSGTRSRIAINSGTTIASRARPVERLISISASRSMTRTASPASTIWRDRGNSCS